MGKVIGAIKCTKDGIKFKSKLERDTYVLLKAMKLSPVYEEKKIELMGGLTHLGQKCLPITYTPDFVIRKNRKKIYIECKGHETEIWRLKKKMFMKWLKDNEPRSGYLEVRKLSDISVLQANHVV